MSAPDAADLLATCHVKVSVLQRMLHTFFDVWFDSELKEQSSLLIPHAV